MAVFPDRIVLKNSTDVQADIESAIGSGGTDEIIEGEVVVGIEATAVKLYSKASNGSIVTISGSGAGGISAVEDDTNPKLGGDLSVNGHEIKSETGNEVTMAPSTGEMVIKGGTDEGKITLNCTNNSHGVSLQSPAHGDYVGSYTLTMPTSAGSNGQVLSTDGSGVLSWVANSGGGGSVTSVNGETGAVSLGVQEMDDFELNQGLITPLPYTNYGAGFSQNGAWGSAQGGGYTELKVGIKDDNGNQFNFGALPSTGTLYYRQSTSGAYTSLQWTSIINMSTYSQWWIRFPVNAPVIPGNQPLYISFMSETPLAQGDLIQWDGTSKFKPVSFTASSVRELLGIEEYADNSAATAGGLSAGDLYFNITNSKYVLRT